MIKKKKFKSQEDLAMLNSLTLKVFKMLLPRLERMLMEDKLECKLQMKELQDKVVTEGVMAAVAEADMAEMTEVTAVVAVVAEADSAVAAVVSAVDEEDSAVAAEAEEVL